MVWNFGCSAPLLFCGYICHTKNIHYKQWWQQFDFCQKMWKEFLMPSFFLFSSPFLRESFPSISRSIEQIIIKIDTENHFEYDTKIVCLYTFTQNRCVTKPCSRFRFFCFHLFSHISLKQVASLVSFFGELIQDFDTARLQL